MPKIKITINDKKLECQEGQSVMEAAKENGIDIPSLCNHPDLPPKVNCRVCVVEIEGQKRLAMSCATKATAGMVIRTDTERVKKARKINTELIFAEHIEKCATCIWRINCKLLSIAGQHKIVMTAFKDRKGNRPTHKIGQAVEIDGTQCIDCRNCVEVCSNVQKINYLKIDGKGVDQEIKPVDDKKIDCIYCGQCALHCPVGSAQEQASWSEVEKVLQDKTKTVVALVSSATLVSIGEEFKEKTDNDFIGKIASALRQLGFKYVFDDGFANMALAGQAAAEITRWQDAGNTPIFTSSCPAWFKYVDFYEPWLKDNLLNIKSPHILGGEMIKGEWASKMDLDPKNIIVVSASPCTAMKYEIAKKESALIVDYALTTRELAWLINKNRLVFKAIKSGKFDNFGKKKNIAGEAGVSGGETELILRALDNLSNNKKGDKLEESIKNLYGTAGIKEAAIDLNGKDFKIGVVNGIGNIKEMLKKQEQYDLIEVMACPEGCVGGGGQPIPTTQKLKKERFDALNKLMKNN